MEGNASQHFAHPTPGRAKSKWEERSTSPIGCPVVVGGWGEGENVGGLLDPGALRENGGGKMVNRWETAGNRRETIR